MKYFMRDVLVALVLFMGLTTLGVAGPLADGDEAYHHGDYATALRLFQPLADQGDALAQSRIGAMYYTGQGVPQDVVEAMHWFRKAADQGEAISQFSLGVMYANGHGVPQDDTEAVKWTRKAADQGNAPAEFNLGAMYANGRGVPQDDAEAVKWARKAADQNFAHAHHSWAHVRRRPGRSTGLYRGLQMVHPCHGTST